MTIPRAHMLLRERVKELPLTGLFESLHEAYRRIRAAGFHRPAPDDFHAFQLAALLKYIILYAAYKKKRLRYDLAPYINQVKRLWEATERGHSYPEDKGLRATFLVRFEYANLPFALHQESVELEKERALSLFVIHAAHYGPKFDINQKFRSDFGLTPEQLICVGWEFYGIFSRRVHWTRGELETRVPEGLKPCVYPALRVLAATRARFKESYKHVRSEDPREVFYEPNPLLWMPIIQDEGRYYAPYPELIAYAVTRGLFFTCGAQWARFSEAFGSTFEKYVGDLLKAHIRAGELISAAEEEAAGYTGKTCDWTILLGDIGVLIECKSSALFSRAKKLATPKAVRTDLVKNLIGQRSGKGLVQIYAKLQAIKNGEMPSPFREKYAKVETWYPVVLLYDQLKNANAREVLRAILNEELGKVGIPEFGHQIWHVEELENLLKLVPEGDLVGRFQTKWTDPKMFELDLNTYLASCLPEHEERLRSYIIVPSGDSSAYKKLKELADV